MSELAAPRRFVLAAAGVLIAGWLLRDQLSDALVVRGDEFLFRGRLQAANRYYARALAFDADSAIAVDRSVFAALLSHHRDALETGVRLAAGYLARHPDNDAVRWDRAMADRVLDDATAAASDFAIVGYRTRDERALALAGLEARRGGARLRARRLLRAALALDPGFPPALRALAREGKRK